jgi:hypothetical protein
MAIDFSKPWQVSTCTPVEIRSPDGMDAHVWTWIDAYERYEADGDASVVRQYFSH